MGYTPSEAQLAALNRGREIGHQRRGTTNRNVCTRVLRDAVAAIEEDGSAIKYFKWVAYQEPASFMKFLGNMLGKYMPQALTELEGERVYRSADEVRAELIRRGLPIPASLVDEDAVAADHERLLSEKQALEVRAKQAESERDAMLRSFGTPIRN